MDSRGGCCIARYTGGGGVYDLSKMDRIMMRYRPIAPKPAVGGSFRDGSPPENYEVRVKSGRGRRKYVKGSSNNNNSGNSSGSTVSKRSCSRKRKNKSPAVVTLPLLPETPDRKDSPEKGSSCESTDVGPVKKMAQNAPIWLSFENTEQLSRDGSDRVMGHGSVGHGVVAPPQNRQRVRVVNSWVKVECVTDAWVDRYGLGRTDEERVMYLQKDTCPGFISDGEKRVRWVNRAYKEMTMANAEGGEVMVFLVMKEGVELPVNRAAVTCQVRVVTCEKEGGKNSSITLPCDVWRMESGGYAWRLDTKAALCLGRY